MTIRFHKTLLSSALVLAIVGAVALPLVAEAKHDKNHGRGHSQCKENQNNRFDHDNDRDWDDDDRFENRSGRNRWNPNSVVFGNRQTDILRDLILGRNTYGLSNRELRALRNQGSLPPGIERNLMRGKPLPPGIARKSAMMPNSFLSTLGFPTNRNLGVGVYGNRPYVYNRSNNVILDVLDSILR
jgi:hypothetical protein